MDSKTIEAGARACWFVGAMFDGGVDQTARFLEEGIWEIENPNLQDMGLVNSMKVGDRIALKSSYTRKKNLPFDNRGNSVSVLAIKAIGEVVEILDAGHKVKVDWSHLESPREWYFYTFRGKIWRVSPSSWDAESLINFTFHDKPQDIDRFRNAPYWRERYGDRSVERPRFVWAKFYEAMAEKLLGYRDNRADLIKGIYEIAPRVGGLSYLHDKYKDGSEGLLNDICPFTVLGIFNRGITDANRKIIAKELATLLGVGEPIPDTFEGIPLLNNQKSCFFGFSINRHDGDIDTLWDIFAKALVYADTDDEPGREAFAEVYDNAANRYGVGWNLTMGLFWIRPWSFPTLESQSQEFIKKRLSIKIGLNGPKNRCNAKDYLALRDTLEARFKEDAYPVHSFPELSLSAWKYEGDSVSSSSVDISQFLKDGDEDTDEAVKSVAPTDSYSIDDILDDGCFVDRAMLERILERLRTKKNLILQGPPGTGKTWLAKRLAFALMEQRNDSKVRAVQFHPNLSYEDFVRGWRPSGDGKLTLVDGPFLQIIESAAEAPGIKHVVVIEEINRGNPAQIFGEMLTLLEADKRTPTEALELCYRRTDDERIFIPDNLYVIGTMNIADRSLALVDLALRRRFAFVDLEPVLGKPWLEWVNSQSGIESEILLEIEKRIKALNEEISADTSLGPQFRMGHSYVTPPLGVLIKDGREWFRQVVATEIGPLLDEYWFDALDKAEKSRERLLAGF